MKIKTNGIEIEVEDSGGGDDPRPTVLLVMGLGVQLTSWPPALVEALGAAGYRVIRFDNRDIGLSQHFDELGLPNLAWATIKDKLGLTLAPPYSLQDMANDALGVLDALSVPRAHLVGVSMGGMISQRVAVAAPARVMSLTSIMSSSGARGLPGIKGSVVRTALTRPAGMAREQLIDHAVLLWKSIASPGFPTDPTALRARLGADLDRSYHPIGAQRHLLALMADHARAALLDQITAPTLVIHGRQDPLVPFPCGEDTARRIPGSKFVPIDGMGHDLAPGAVVRVLEALLPHLKATTPRAG